MTTIHSISQPKRRKLLSELGVDAARYTGGTLRVTSPVTGKEIGLLKEHSVADAKKAIDEAHKAFAAWRAVPAPKRGELVRLLGEELRAAKAGARPPRLDRSRQDHLGRSRRSAGDDRHLRLRRRPVAPALRPDDRHRAPGHRMMESWHPLGVVGVISAFNFPVAVWSWNAALALVCGEPSSGSRRKRRR